VVRGGALPAFGGVLGVAAPAPLGGEVLGVASTLGGATLGLGAGRLAVVGGALAVAGGVLAGRAGAPLTGCDLPLASGGRLARFGGALLAATRGSSPQASSRSSSFLLMPSRP
jgi:hypothetical protein